MRGSEVGLRGKRDKWDLRSLRETREWSRRCRGCSQLTECRTPCCSADHAERANTPWPSSSPTQRTARVVRPTPAANADRCPGVHDVPGGYAHPAWYHEKDGVRDS